MADDPLKDINQFDKALVRVADLIHVMTKMGRSMEDVGEISKELKGHFDTLDKSADGIRERFKGTSKVLIDAMQKQGISSKNVEIAIKTLASSMNAHLKDIKGLSEAEKLATIAQRNRNDALAQEIVLKHQMSSSNISNLVAAGQYGDAVQQTGKAFNSAIPGLNEAILVLGFLGKAADASQTELNKTNLVLRGTFGGKSQQPLRDASAAMVRALQEGGTFSEEAANSMVRSFASIPNLAEDMNSSVSKNVITMLASWGLTSSEIERFVVNSADETGASFRNISESMDMAGETADSHNMGVRRGTGMLLEMRGAMLQSGQSINAMTPAIRALGKIDWIRNSPALFSKMTLSWANFTQGFSPSRLAGLMMYTKNLSGVPDASELGKPGAEGGLLLGEAYKKAFKESGMPPGQELYFTEAFAKNMGIPMGNSLESLKMVQGLLNEGKSMDAVAKEVNKAGLMNTEGAVNEAVKELRSAKDLQTQMKDSLKGMLAEFTTKRVFQDLKEAVTGGVTDAFSKSGIQRAVVYAVVPAPLRAIADFGPAKEKTAVTK